METKLQVTRYDCRVDGDYIGGTSAPDGDWVYFSDYEELAQEKENLQTALSYSVSECGKWKAAIEKQSERANVLRDEVVRLSGKLAGMSKAIQKEMDDLVPSEFDDAYNKGILEGLKIAMKRLENMK